MHILYMYIYTYCLDVMHLSQLYSLCIAFKGLKGTLQNIVLRRNIELLTVLKTTDLETKQA
jgi:hypothetical protein